MAADARIPPHRSFWRRLRRRYWPGPRWIAMVAPVGFALRYSVLAWFGRDGSWGWVAEAVRWGWFATGALWLFAICSTAGATRRWSRLAPDLPRRGFLEG